MLPKGTWIGLRGLGASLAADMEGAREVRRFITLRKALAYAVIFPWLACVLVIILGLLGFTVLAAKLLFGSIAFLERVNTAFLYGKTRT